MDVNDSESSDLDSDQDPDQLELTFKSSRSSDDFMIAVDENANNDIKDEFVGNKFSLDHTSTSSSNSLLSFARSAQDVHALFSSVYSDQDFSNVPEEHVNLLKECFYKRASVEEKEAFLRHWIDAFKINVDRPVYVHT